MTAALWSAMAASLLAGTGCQEMNLGWWNWFDPSKQIRTPDRATVNPIFSQVGPADQTQELVPNATMPKPEDLVYVEEDYIIGPSDIMTIEILDLFQEGVPMIMGRQVSHSGHIPLPLLTEQVKADGLTSEELTEAIKKAYQPDVLRDPVVSVTVTGPQQNTYSMLGAVGRSGPFPILRKNFTLLEALAAAGDVTQMGIEWAYVIRPAREDKPTTRPAVAPPTKPAEPQTQEERLRELDKFIPGTAARPADDERILLSSVSTTPAPSAATAPTHATESAETYQWIYSGGRWIRVLVKVPTTKPKPGAQAPKAPPKPIAAPEKPKDKDPFKWAQHDLSGRARIIAINLADLKAGNPRVNIIIRDNDIIHVPPLTVGEFYMIGEVLRPGVYSLTGRQITAKMAVAAAGNLAPLSWPNNSILIRRVGRQQEQTFPLPLQDIFAGREPDIFLKPNDIIAVGSHWSTPFLAVWRNAFRLTYGFGFIYDRNYSETDFEIPFLSPDSGFRPDR